MARRAPRTEETPPWLEPAAPAQEHTLVSWRTLIIGAAVALACAVGLVLGVKALIARDRAEAEVVASAEEVPIIRAPDGPYKVRPEDPGGVQLEGVDDTIYAAGQGVDPDGRIDLSALPEEPVEPGEPVDLIAQTLPPEGALDAADAGEPLEGREGAVAAPRPAEPVRPARGAVAPAPGAAEAPVAAGSAAVQLGAFSSRAKADAAWTSFTGRFGYLEGLSKQVEATRREGETLYRLRAGGIASRAQAQALCQRLKVAGESCMVAE